jgi:CSLREA domain-containing protein
MKPIRMLTVGLVVTGSLALAPPAEAATINVTTTADEYLDPGPETGCALREAIQAANTDAPFGGCSAGNGPDTINVPAGTYALSIPGSEDANAQGDLDVSSNVTIDPTGTVVIDGADLDRVFQVSGGVSTALSISDLTIRNGKTTNDAGAGIDSISPLTLAGVTLTGNEADGNGGAVALAGGGSHSLRNTTISGNTATGNGGGLTVASGTVTVNNVTIANNTADDEANGTGNGGGIFVQAGTVTISNTIVGDNTDKSPGATDKHDDCSGTLASSGYNLIENATGCTIAGTTPGNITGKSPQLIALADNGGPTPTHALRKGSPAVDAGNPAAPGSSATACEATDQRGIARPQGPRCDIGSFEREQPSDVQCLGRPVTMTGTSGNDVLTGTMKRDVIRALGGDDVINALGGNDRVCAGAGNDRVNGRSGRDVVAGGAGNDRVRGAGGDDDLRGQSGRDRLKGKGGDDVLRGGPEPDALNGGGGIDTCRGGGGRDRIRRCE